METRGQKGARDLEMGGVGGGDGDQIDPVLAPLFAFEHLAPVAIGPVRRKAERLPIAAPCVGPVIERAGDEIEQAVNPCPQPVGRADLASFAAADQAPFQICHGRNP